MLAADSNAGVAALRDSGTLINGTAFDRGVHGLTVTCADDGDKVGFLAEDQVESSPIHELFLHIGASDCVGVGLVQRFSRVGIDDHQHGAGVPNIAG